MVSQENVARRRPVWLIYASHGLAFDEHGCISEGRTYQFPADTWTRPQFPVTGAIL